MPSSRTYDLIIIGAGPIGLEAALWAGEVGLDYLVLDKSGVASSLEKWGFVRMFSPWSMNISPLGKRLLGFDPPNNCPTGRQIKNDYYTRLAELPTIASHLTTGFTAKRISRQGLMKGSLVGQKSRADFPFMIYGENASGKEQYLLSHAIIDATGVYDNHNFLGPGGLPAIGERAAENHISYQLVEPDRIKQLGKRFLVVGAGHSASTMINQLDNIILSDNGISAQWVVSGDADPPVAEFDDDPLPERQKIVRSVNAISCGNNPAIEFLSGRWVESIENGQSGASLKVTLLGKDSSRSTVECDHILAMIGYRPDRILYEELQVHECYASAGPMKLAAKLLSAGASSDCLAPVEGGDDLYDNPEPNFYILGSKSYGRSTNFLIQKGHDQIATVFKKITGDDSLNLYVSRPNKVSTPKVNTDGDLGHIALDSLDNLWFQIGGTICNLRCGHCFISCSPENDKFKMMSRAEIEPYLNEARSMGVKEFYFTGGEPFLNPEIMEILETTMKIGPATVLTNGTIITPRRAERLAQIFNDSIYSLEVRVSLDGFDAESNDRFRGKGNFDKAIKGLNRLVQVGLLPIVTAVQTWTEEENESVVKEFVDLLRSQGYNQPRLKIIPALDLGAYRANSIGPGEKRMVTRELLHGMDLSQFLCHNTRMVTDKGVYVCPILIDYPDAKLGNSLTDMADDYPLRHAACYTCYLSGAICSNFTTGGLTER